MATKVRTVYEYTVEGSGSFPVDMIRYDSAIPLSENDSATITATFGRGTFTSRWKVKMRSEHRPTDGRWESFGWRVADDVRERRY